MTTKKRKNKPSRNSTYYDADYTPEEFHTMKRYGADDLYNEVELIRTLMFRALVKMNKDIKKLTFQDHLAALHAFSRSSGRVAHLMEAQQRLFPPQEQLRQLSRKINEKLAEAIDKDVIMYKEKGEEIPDFLLEMQRVSFERMFAEEE